METFNIDAIAQDLYQKINDSKISEACADYNAIDPNHQDQVRSSLNYLIRN